MILTADIGNTNITLGIFKDDAPVCISRLATQRHRTSEQYAIELKAIFELENIKTNFEGAVISSVVPELTRAFKDAIKKCLEDISIKTKSVLDMKKRKGVYSLPKVPYGYRKSDKDKYKIEIYEPEAKYIRMIFNIYKEGYSISEIVTLLNNRECELSSGYNNKSHIIEKKIWNYHRVYRILHNEFYNGIMVYGKTSGHIWEGKKRKNITRSQWKY